mmetsp:Transcript_84970/g.263958  ORF Transcript_84970/g.263958 Transcript_84970/m.263958 type:complete len:294 (-) Transcript_84970:618-1499(-)
MEWGHGEPGPRQAEPRQKASMHAQRTLGARGGRGLPPSLVGPPVPEQELRVHLVFVVDHKVARGPRAALAPVPQDAVVPPAGALLDEVQDVGQDRAVREDPAESHAAEEHAAKALKTVGREELVDLACPLAEVAAPAVEPPVLRAGSGDVEVGARDVLGGARGDAVEEPSDIGLLVEVDAEAVEVCGHGGVRRARNLAYIPGRLTLRLWLGELRADLLPPRHEAGPCLPVLLAVALHQLNALRRQGVALTLAWRGFRNGQFGAGVGGREDPLQLCQLHGSELHARHPGVRAQG